VLLVPECPLVNPPREMDGEEEEERDDEVVKCESVVLPDFGLSSVGLLAVKALTCGAVV
jgi:hypothetical protein